MRELVERSLSHVKKTLFHVHERERRDGGEKEKKQQEREREVSKEE